MLLAALAASAASLLGLPKLPPKLPIPSTTVKAVVEPDCSATKTIPLPPLRVFGMAPTRGVDWVPTLVEPTLSAGVRRLPGGIDVWLTLKATSPKWNGTSYERQQHLRFAVTPPPGCEVASAGVVNTTVALRGIGEYERVYGTGFIAEALCMGDIASYEKIAGTGCRQVKLQPITVTFRKKADAVCGTITFQPPPLDAMTMKRIVSGNEGVSGSEAYVEVDVDEEVVDSRVKLKTRVTIEEDWGDHSRFTTDWIGATVFDAAVHAPGCKVKSIEAATGQLRDRAVASPAAGYRATVLDGTAPGTARRGVVKDAACRTLGDWKRQGCMVRFNPITIHLGA